MEKMSSKYLNDNGELIFRPSSVGNIMASGKNKDELSVGAKTFVKSIFKKVHLGYEEELFGKEIEKGKTQENDGIKLLNIFLGTDYQKNEITMNNTYLKGTADIVDVNSIRDIKLPWSKKTHPLFAEDVSNSLYEWQLRAYMMLYDKDEAYLDYCLVSTSVGLIPPYESRQLHNVEDLDLKYRITSVKFERDYFKEMALIEKIEQCRNEWNKLLTKFN